MTFNQESVPLDATLRDLIKIKNKDRYKTRIIRQTMLDLYETGRVKSVQLEVTPISEVEIEIQWVITEKKAIAKVSLSGQRRFSQKEIFDALRFSPGERIDEAEWGKRVSSLYTLYKNEGYFNVQIESIFQPLPGEPAFRSVELKIAEGDRARIQTLTFTGNRVFPHFVLRLSVLSWTLEHFSLKLLSSDIARLKAFYKKKGYLKAVIGPPSINFLPNRNRVKVMLPISAGPKIDFIFHGVSTHVGLESLAPLVVMSEEGEDERALEDAGRSIENFYHEKGYPFVQVQVKAKWFSGGKICDLTMNKAAVCDRMEAHFTITNKIRTRIRRIEFVGNSIFSKKRLQKLVQIKEEGFLVKTHYTKEKLQDDVENIRLFYKKEGFHAVQIESAIHYPNEGQKWATLTFQIQEGIRTQIDPIVLRGAVQLSQEVISSALRLWRSAPYNKEAVREGALQIVTLYARRGYADAKVDTVVTFSSDSSQAKVEYEITEGEQIFFGPLQVTGFLKTKEVVILREMRFQEGEPYDYEKVLMSQQRLSQTGLFSGIRFEPTRSLTDRNISNVHLAVVERPRVAMEWGPGYQDRDGFRGFFELTHRNLFGTGRRISGRAEASRIERRYSLHYKEPHIFSYDTNAIISATYFLTQAGSFNPFDEEAFVGTVSFEKNLSRLWKAVILYEYKDTNITNVTPGVTLTAQDTGRLIVGSFNPSLIYDTRNDLFNPTAGSLHAITVRSAAKLLGSETQLFKMTYQSSFFTSPTPKSTLAFSLRVGGARKFGETNIIPLSERFFSGGRSSVRGYVQNRLGVDGETINNGIPTGGNAILVLNEEIRFLIFKSFGGVFFFDHGNVWREFKEIKLSDMRSSVGAGLRLNTPVGPLRIDWGYKLNREKLESPAEYHFMLGHAF